MKKWVATFYSAMIIPLSGDNWLDLQYSDLKSNKVNLGESISIKVNKTASPLFYNLSGPKKIKSVEVHGIVDIKKAINPEKDDSYFQIGFIEMGHFKPSWIVRRFLPKWLTTLVNMNLNKDYGVGNIYFYGITDQKINKQSEKTMQSLKLFFKDVATFGENGKFKLIMELPEDRPYIAFWVRADGDDSDGIFDLKINRIQLVD